MGRLSRSSVLSLTLQTIRTGLDLSTPSTPSTRWTLTGGGACWIVTLRAQVGPFARLKKLRMVRVEEDFPELIRFSRKETDSKDHSDWDLHVTINEKESMGCSVQMVVSYSGGFWSVPLQAVFTSHVETAKVRLQETFASNDDSSES